MEAESNLVRTMRSRVRRHMLLSGGTLLLVIPLEAGARLLVRALGLASPWSGVFFFIPILLIPVVGFASTFKLLRCPACERLVALQVSSHYAVMGPLPTRACLRCGKEIFGDPRVTRRRMAYMIVGVMITSFLVFLVVALADIPRHPR